MVALYKTGRGRVSNIFPWPVWDSGFRPVSSLGMGNYKKCWDRNGIGKPSLKPAPLPTLTPLSKTKNLERLKVMKR